LTGIEYKCSKSLVERKSKRFDEQIYGRADINKMVVFDRGNFEKSDYVVSLRKQITQYKYCIKSFIFATLKEM
jgi:hypothetical protein